MLKIYSLARPLPFGKNINECISKTSPVIFNTSHLELHPFKYKYQNHIKTPRGDIIFDYYQRITAITIIQKNITNTDLPMLVYLICLTTFIIFISETIIVVGNSISSA